MGKTETRRVNGLPDIQGSGVAQLGQNPVARDEGVFLCFLAPLSLSLSWSEQEKEWILPET